MDNPAKEKLIRIYQGISNKKPEHCLKFHYVYNGVNVNLYFDYFDKKSMSLSLILVADKVFYFTPLNILNKGLNKEYLPKMPFEILSKILQDGKLDDFYRNMETHILQDNPHINYYSKDKIFTNTLKFKKGNIDLPFWKTVRRIRMPENTLINLSHRADISIEVLRKVQNNNLTLVRTAKPEERRELTLILSEHNINL